MSDKDNQKPLRLIPVLITTGIFFLLVLACNYWWLHGDAQQGDMFGFANAVFSGVAFVGVVCTVLIQGQELKLQRQELSLNREELARQREEMASQAITLRQQAFENTFFQLLNLQNEITKAIDLRVANGVTAVGRDCFSTFCKRHHFRYTQGNSSQPEEERLEIAYQGFYDMHGHEIGHYFRNLYNIIKFIDQSSVKNKKLYTNIVRAQLSNYELTLLFYNCLSSFGRNKFKPLIERYALLKTLDIKSLCNPLAHQKLYASGAFGTQSEKAE